MSNIPQQSPVYRSTTSGIDFQEMHKTLSEGEDRSDWVLYSKNTEDIKGGSTEYGITKPTEDYLEKGPEKMHRRVGETLRTALASYCGGNEKMLMAASCLLEGTPLLGDTLELSPEVRELTTTNFLDATSSRNRTVRDQRIEGTPVTLGTVQKIVAEMQMIDWLTEGLADSIHVNPERFEKLHRDELTPEAVVLLKALAEMQKTLSTSRLKSEEILDGLSMINSVIKDLKENEHVLVKPESSGSREVHLEKQRKLFTEAELNKEAWPYYESLFSAEYSERDPVKIGLGRLLSGLKAELMQQPEYVAVAHAEKNMPVVNAKGEYNLENVLSCLKENQFSVTKSFVKHAHELAKLAPGLQEHLNTIKSEGIEVLKSDKSIVKEKLPALAEISIASELARLIWLASRSIEGTVMLAKLLNALSTIPETIKDDDKFIATLHLNKFLMVTIGKVWIGDSLTPKSQSFSEMDKRATPADNSSSNRPSTVSKTQINTDMARVGDQLKSLNDWLFVQVNRVALAEARAKTA